MKEYYYKEVENTVKRSEFLFIFFRYSVFSLDDKENRNMCIVFVNTI